MSLPRVRYLRTTDDLQLAWAESGSGPLLIQSGSWLAHLEHDLVSPVWRHWINFFSDRFCYVRYDERGCGMSDWNVKNLSLDRWVDDLEDVVAAVGPREPFTLLGISYGAAVSIAYAIRHPRQVSRLILYGGFAQGWSRRGDPAGLRFYKAIVELVRSGWSKDNPVFRQVFTSRFIPGATEPQISWFNEFCTKATSPVNAAALLAARADIDITAMLGMLDVPTLVLHASGDQTVPISQGRLLASRIRGAEFVQLDSVNHILLEDEHAWIRFREAVLQFTDTDDVAEPVEDSPFASLSPRELQILTLVADGLANADIAERLSISDKTVRNHVSHLYDKLGVWTRAQAIVFARDRGLRG
jgi:pimeloyl-ACP methyl ester carboxylesterase/DNA-binding CsgD family transcriptional regulator